MMQSVSVTVTVFQPVIKNHIGNFIFQARLAFSDDFSLHSMPHAIPPLIPVRQDVKIKLNYYIDMILCYDPYEPIRGINLRDEDSPSSLPWKVFFFTTYVYLSLLCFLSSFSLLFIERTYHWWRHSLFNYYFLFEARGGLRKNQNVNYCFNYVV